MDGTDTPGEAKMKELVQKQVTITAEEDGYVVEGPLVRRPICYPHLGTALKKAKDLILQNSE